MENRDTNELIEQYLNGALSAADRQAVEDRLAADADFRAEMELHRQLYTEFTDPRKLQLRDLLSNIVQETPAPPPSGQSTWLKGLGIALLILVSSWMAWLWFSSTPEQRTPPSDRQEMKPPSTAPGVVSPTADTPAGALGKTQAPIAMVNPADFAKNPTFEPRLGSHIRSEDDTITIQSPALRAHFTPRNGVVNIPFRGAVSANANTTAYPLVIKIFNNRTEEPIQVLPTLTDRKSTSEPWILYKVARLKLNTGLYYFTVERQADAQIIFVGTFTVGKQSR